MESSVMGLKKIKKIEKIIFFSDNIRIFSEKIATLYVSKGKHIPKVFLDSEVNPTSSISLKRINDSFPRKSGLLLSHNSSLFFM